MRSLRFAWVLPLACGTAFAQSGSTVSIYGVADAAVESVRANGGSPDSSTYRARLSSEGSYIGFRGSEALGSGLSAIFQLEGGYSIDTGEMSSGFNRDTFVGLASEQGGRLTLGLNTTPMRALGLALDLTPGGNTGIGAIQSLLSINGRSSGSDNRRPNSVRYRSPTFNHVTVDVVYGFGEERGVTPGRNNYMYGAGVTYQDGALFIGYAFDRQSDSNQAGLAQTDGSDTRHRLGAKYYMMPQLQVGAFYDMASSSGRFGAGTGKLTKDSWGLITRWESGAHGVYAMFVKAKSVECSGVTTGNGVGCAAAANTDARMLTLGYTYAFSKRTMIRAAVSRITNANAARYDFSNGSIGGGVGADPTGYSIGLRHRF